MNSKRLNPIHHRIPKFKTRSGDLQGYPVSKELEASNFPPPNNLNYVRCLPSRKILFLDYCDFIGNIIKCDNQWSIRQFWYFFL